MSENSTNEGNPVERDDNYRSISWGGIDIVSELDDDGNYIMSFYRQSDGEIELSVGLTTEQAEGLFDIHKF